MKGYIYKIQNKVNGKSYIGQTHRGVTQRMNEHLGSKGISLLHSASLKYGKENFELNILAEIERDNIKHLTQILDILEINLIKTHKTLIPNGYNVTPGGMGGRGKKQTSETREKIAVANRGLKRPHMAQYMDKIHEAVKKPIQCAETGQIWTSVKDCAAFFNVKPKQISRVLKGQRKRLKWQFTFIYL